MKKHIVVITGGSGFLGQHLVKELQENWRQEVEEIRIIDKRVFNNFLGKFEITCYFLFYLFHVGFPENIPIREFIADCSIASEIDNVLIGATIVFNLCGRKFEFDVYQEKELYLIDNKTCKF